MAGKCLLYNNSNTVSGCDDRNDHWTALFLYCCNCRFSGDNIDDPYAGMHVFCNNRKLWVICIKRFYKTDLLGDDNEASMDEPLVQHSVEYY